VRQIDNLVIAAGPFGRRRDSSCFLFSVYTTNSCRRNYREVGSCGPGRKLHKEIEAKRKEVLLEAKEEAFKIRGEIEQENKEKRAEIQRLERRLTQKEETLDRRLDNLDRKERTITQKEPKRRRGWKKPKRS